MVAAHATQTPFASTRSGAIRAQLERGLWIVPARVGGEQVNAILSVSTIQSALSPKFRPGGEDGKTEVRIGRLDLGSFAIPSVELPLFDGKFLGTRVDAVIGLDVIGSFALEFDVLGTTIEVRSDVDITPGDWIRDKPRWPTSKKAPDAIAIGLEKTYGPAFSISGNVLGHDVDFLLSNDSSGSAIKKGLVPEAEQLTYETKTQTSGITGESLESRTVLLPNIRLGDVEIPYARVALDDSMPAEGLAEPVEGRTSLEMFPSRFFLFNLPKKLLSMEHLSAPDTRALSASNAVGVPFYIDAAFLWRSAQLFLGPFDQSGLNSLKLQAHDGLPIKDLNLVSSAHLAAKLRVGSEDALELIRLILRRGDGSVRVEMEGGYGPLVFRRGTLIGDEPPRPCQSPSLAIARRISSSGYWCGYVGSRAALLRNSRASSRLPVFVSAW